MEAVQRFYVDSRACVRVEMNVDEWFPVIVGFRKGCVLHIYMDGEVRYVNASIFGKGPELLPVNGGWFEINHLFTD